MTAPHRPDFGFGTVIATTLGVFLRRFGAVFLVTAPGLVVTTMLVIAGATFEDWSGIRLSMTGVPNALQGAVLLAALGVTAGLCAGLIGGPLARVVEDALDERGVRLGRALSATFTRTVRSILVGQLVVLGTLAPLMVIVLIGLRPGVFVLLVLVLAGTYALGLWGMAIACVHMDRLGLGALGRSVRLGQGYRFTVAGSFFVLFLVSVLAGGVVTVGLAILTYFLREFFPINDQTIPHFRAVRILLIWTAGSSFAIPLMCIGAAVIRARLVAIKEPPDIKKVLHVFE